MESKTNQLLYPTLFGGVFSTIEECDKSPVIQSPMYSRAVKMIKTFLKLGLQKSVLEDDLVNWINSEVLDHLKQDNSFQSICGKGYYSLVEWMLKNKKPTPIEVSQGFVSACGNGYLKIAEFLTEKFPKITADVCTNAFISACGGKNLDLIQWLVLTFPHINVKMNRSQGFINMCRAESLKILKWFTEKYPDVHREAPSVAFIEACADQGSLKIAKFLFEKYPISKQDLDFAFSKACENGHLEIVKWFLQRGAIVVDRDTYSQVLAEENFEIATLLIEKNCVDKNEAFVMLCSYGDFSLAREVLAKYPEIDVHANDDEALRNTVQDSHSEIAKWLMEKYIEDN